MELKTPKELRMMKMNSIRSELKAVPIIKSTSMKIQQKIQKNITKDKIQSILHIGNTQSDNDNDSQRQQNISLFFQKYQVGQKIGEGAHGVVRKCYQKQTQKIYAVKTITLDRQHILFLKQNFIQVKQLDHPHICKYKAIYFQMHTDTCYLVMDYLPFPNLLKIQISSQDMLRIIIFQILQTLKYIHNRHICHRDIKPQNILWDQQNQSIKIIDFGISKKLFYRGTKNQMLTVTGTPYYRAPEMFQGGGYDEKVDLWAVGVTMFKLMTGTTPFESEYHSDTIANIMRGQVIFPQNIILKYSKSCRRLVIQLLKKRQLRLSSAEALRDIWFSQMHDHDQFTRSLTFNQKFGNNSLDPHGRSSLIRQNTSQYIDLRLSINSKLKQQNQQKIDIKSLISDKQSDIYGMNEQKPKSNINLRSPSSKEIEKS